MYNLYAHTHTHIYIYIYNSPFLVKFPYIPAGILVQINHGTIKHYTSVKQEVA